MRRNMGVALSLLGLLAVLGGVIAGMFKNSSNSHTATIKPETPYVYTASGVLDQLKAPVTFTLTGEADAEISYALGAPVDVEAWAQGLSSTKITGLTGGETLNAETGEAAQDVGEIPDLLTSDMWLEKGSGKGEVTKTYRVQTPGTIALIATSSDGKAPKVELTWQTQEKAAVTVPIILIGILTLLVGGVLLFLHEQERRRMMERRAVRERKIARRAARAEAATDVLSLSDIAASSRSAQSAATGRALGAGILVASPRAQEFRSRELSDADRIVLDTTTEKENAEEKGKDLFKKRRSRRKEKESLSSLEAATTRSESEENSADAAGTAQNKDEKTERLTPQDNTRNDERIASHDENKTAASDTDRRIDRGRHGRGTAFTSDNDPVSLTAEQSSDKQVSSNAEGTEEKVDREHRTDTSASGRSEQWRNRWNFALNDEPTKEN